MKLLLSITIALFFCSDLYAKEFKIPGKPIPSKNCKTAATVKTCSDKSRLGAIMRRKCERQCRVVLKSVYAKKFKFKGRTIKTVSKVSKGVRLREEVRQTHDPVQAEVIMSGFDGDAKSKQYKHSVSTYKDDNSLPIVHNEEGDEDILLEARALEDKYQTPGIRSCGEFVYKKHHSLSRVEELAASKQFSTIELLTKIDNNGWALDDLTYNTMRPQDINIKALENDQLTIGLPASNKKYRACKAGIPTPGSSFCHMNILREHHSKGRWSRNAFVTYPLESVTSNRSPYGYILTDYDIDIPVEISPEVLALNKKWYTVRIQGKKLYNVPSMLSDLKRLKAKGITSAYLEQLQHFQTKYLKLLVKRSRINKSVADTISKVINRPGCLKNLGGGKYEFLCQQDWDYEVDQHLYYSKVAAKKLDKEITKMVMEAKEFGCFDYKYDGDLSPCDISPSVVEEFLNMSFEVFDQQREKDFEWCEKITKTSGGYFYANWDDYSHLLKGKQSCANDPYGDGLWDRDNHLFTSCFDHTVEKQKALTNKAKKAPFISTEIPGHRKELGEKNSDGGFFGLTFKGSKVGAGYNYGNKWYAYGFDQSACKTSFNFENHFNLKVKVFSYSKTILDFDQNLGLDATNVSNSSLGAKADLSFTMLNKEYIALDGMHENENIFNKRLLKAGLGLNNGRDEFHKDLPGYEATVSVFGVPLTLRAAPGIAVGVDGAIEFKNYKTCKATGLVGNGIGVNMTPTGAAQFAASASVDLYFTDIGVKGRLDLVKLGLPLDISTGVYGKTLQSSELSAQMNSDVELSTLSGKVSAYLDTFWGKKERTIFKWKGPKWSKEIFKARGSWDATALGSIVK